MIKTSSHSYEFIDKTANNNDIITGVDSFCCINIGGMMHNFISKNKLSLVAFTFSTLIFTGSVLSMEEKNITEVTKKEKSNISKGGIEFYEFNNDNEAGLKILSLIKDSSTGTKRKVIELTKVLGSLGLSKASKILNTKLDNKTLLEQAVTIEDPEVVALLLKFGANPNVPNSYGGNLLMYVMRNLEGDELIDMIKAFLDPTNPILTNPNLGGWSEGTPFTEALENNNIEVITLFLNYKHPKTGKLLTDLNIITQNGDPLYYAIARRRDNKDRAQIVKLLLEAGADINHPIGNQSTAFMYAIKNKSEATSEEYAQSLDKVIDEFLKYSDKIKFDLQNNPGQTAFDLADEKTKEKIKNALSKKN